MDPPPSASFSDFPDDVKLAVLSFLSPEELSAFACSSRHFSTLCSPRSPSSILYRWMCDRRWGSKTLIHRWGPHNFPILYKVLDGWDPLIGFWRQIGTSKNLQSPPLVLFEWGPSSITASRVSPSPDTGSYGVVKKPFLWLGISKSGEPISFLSASEAGSDSELVPVTVSFMGRNHVVVEESGGGLGLESRAEQEEFRGSGSPPNEAMLEIYQYFANRTSPSGDKGSRRQRKKKVGRRRWDPEHFVKIQSCCPSPARPLQGLWKGICESMCLDFYLVTYDDVGGISCRRVGDSREPFSGYSPVFWTSNTQFSIFSGEEQNLYSTRTHVAQKHCSIDMGVVSRYLSINSSYELVLPNLSGSSGDPRNVEGRIWEYQNGTFGFGFLRNNFIVDLKHVALNGCLLDTVEYCSGSGSSSP